MLGAKTIYLAGALAVSALTVAGCSSGGTSSSSQQTLSPTLSSLIAGGSAQAKAQAACNKVIYDDAIVTEATIKACDKGNTVEAHTCQTSGTVYQITISGATVLMMPGKKPAAYGNNNFYAGSFNEMCGDPLDSVETTPPPPMSQAQVRSLFPNGPSSQ